MEEKKNVSEYILEIHNSIKELNGYYKNIDNSLKIILNKLNNSSTTSEKVVSKEIVQPSKDKTTPAKAVRISEPTSEDVLVVHKTPISQLISTKTGAPLTLAGVEILDSKNKPVQQARTNSKGKLITSLLPGNYTIHVKKKATNDLKVPVEARFPITVSESKTVVELDPYVIS